MKIRVYYMKKVVSDKVRYPLRLDPSWGNPPALPPPTYISHGGLQPFRADECTFDTTPVLAKAWVEARATHYLSNEYVWEVLGGLPKQQLIDFQPT